jgi:WD40 repeat protein
VTYAAFTADDRTVYTSSYDGSVIGWDLANLNNLGTRLVAPDPNRNPGVTWAAASRDGNIAVALSDGTVRFWRGNRTTPSGPIRITHGQILGGAFSPDGRLLALSVYPHQAHNASQVGWSQLDLVGARAGRVIPTPVRIPGAVWSLAFSPNGRYLAAAADINMLYVVDMQSRRIVERLAVVDHPRQEAWSPDSRRIAVGSWLGGGIAVYDLSRRSRLWSEPEWDGLAWSPDGTTVATGDASGVTTLWRAADGRRAGVRWPDHTLTSHLTYSPDGSILASAGFEGAVVLRDVASGEQLGPPLVASYNQQTFVWFDSPRQLVVASADNGLWRWNIDVRSMISTACRIAGRNLTTQEWAALRTGRQYVRACA